MVTNFGKEYAGKEYVMKTQVDVSLETPEGDIVQVDIIGTEELEYDITHPTDVSPITPSEVMDLVPTLDLDEGVNIVCYADCDIHSATFKLEIFGGDARGVRKALSALLDNLR